MAEKKPSQPSEATTQGVPATVPAPPQAAMTLWKKPNKPVTLSIPSHWEADPNCGEYMTTLDENDPKQAKMVALALAGKTKSGKDSQNKRLSVIGLTVCPFLSAKDNNGDQSSKIGFFLHTAKETVFVAHYHAKVDMLALVGRYGIPTLSNPLDVVIDPVPEVGTYRVLAFDLVDA